MKQLCNLLWADQNVCVPAMIHIDAGREVTSTCMLTEVSLEAGNWRIPPATPQVISADNFDKLHRFSQFSG